MSRVAQASSKVIAENWSNYLWWPGWSADGTRFTSATADHPEVIRVLDADGAPSAELAGHTAGVNAARWSPVESVVATASWDGTLRLWSETGQLLKTIPLIEEGSVEGVNWSPDGRQLAAACSDGSVYTLSSETGAVLREWHVEGEAFYAAWSPDGATFALTKQNGWAFVDLSRGSIRDHKHESAGIEISWRPDGEVAIITCDDGNLWLDRGDAEPELFRSLGEPTLGVDWHPSRVLAVGDDGGRVHLLDETGEELWSTQLGAQVIAVKWRPGASELLVGTRASRAGLLGFEGLPCV